MFMVRGRLCSVLCGSLGLLVHLAAMAHVLTDHAARPPVELKVMLDGGPHEHFVW